MHWEVYLNGPEAVLDDSAHALEKGDPTLARIGDQFVLGSRTFGNLPDATAVRAAAEHIVEALSGISRNLLESERPLNIASLTGVSAEGKRNIFVQLEPAVLKIKAGLISVSITHADGTIDEHRASDPAPSWLAKALADPAAPRAL
jgi:hypothetical protein